MIFSTSLAHLLYRSDLIKKTTLLKEMSTNLNTSGFIHRYDQAIVENAPLELVSTLLNDDWSSIEHRITISNIQCQYSDTFRSVASFDATGNMETLWEGYLSMEADEWLDWFESLPSKMNKQRIIVYTAQRANRAGNTAFNRLVRAYAIKNGYIAKN